MATTNPIDPIVITRDYAHSAQKIFDAFAKADALEKWIAPSDAIATKVLIHEFAIGGQYRIQFTLPDGQDLYLSGEYVLITEPSQICFTWQWEAPDTHAHIQSLVTVTITTKTDKTQLTILHENLSEVEAIERHAQGWHGAIARLTTLLA